MEPRYDAELKRLYELRKKSPIYRAFINYRINVVYLERQLLIMSLIRDPRQRISYPPDVFKHYLTIYLSEDPSIEDPSFDEISYYN